MLDREELGKLIYDMCSGLSLEEFVRLMTNEYEAAIDYADLCDGKRAGQKISLLFNPQRLDVRIVEYSRSMFEAFRDERFCSGFARATLYKLEHGRYNEMFYQVMQMGVNHTQYANEFPPHKMMAYCIYHKLDRDSVVLDPCAGWGGRMIGTSAVCGKYVAYEPCERTWVGLQELAKFLRKFSPEFEAEVCMVPYEDAEVGEECFDFALTSPPYYDTELYCEEETNSCNRYENFDAWCDGFYIPMIEKTMRALKDGCCFVLNIGSRRYPLNEVLMDVFGKLYEITREGTVKENEGLRKNGEGETFYEIRKV